jgi:UDP-N-acetylglucosamine--N-acetylmuramyl-(pentapeptide) pyrophosphoryl-undecaprenol N-acetylglucosamine transferase
MEERRGGPLMMVAAGGTGGHLFPAEALAVALARRGITVDLATDERATRYGTQFPARTTHIIPSDTVRARNPVALARTGAVLSYGVAKAWRLMGRLRPAAVVGFGGYPTIPPLMAASLRRIPTVIHDANAIIGRANRLLAPRVDAIATGFRGVLDREVALAAKATHTGNPVRLAVVDAAATPYAPPHLSGPVRLTVFGGSQGARVMADIVPPAIERLEPALWSRLAIVQQARAEDVERVRKTYAALKIVADVAPFFPDLPTRIAESHLVVARSGASTVAELGAIGRPAILVPLPHALDQDQLANATVLVKAGGAVCVSQDELTPDRLASEISTLLAEPQRLAMMAKGARSVGTLDAADRLADLVMQVAGRKMLDAGKTK